MIVGCDWLKRVGGIMIVTMLLAVSSGGEEIRGYEDAGYSPSGSHGTFSGTGEGSEVYRIGPNDTLRISVWQNPDLTREVTVRFDGKISYDLVGDVQAAGLTPDELDAELTERLREFIRNPQVTVVVESFRSRQVLVLGAVGTPGVYPLEGMVRILEVLTAAGMDLESADIERVTVMRSNGEALRVDLHALLYESRYDQNIVLQANDTIFVPDRESVGERTSEIMVLGEVSNPGTVSFPTDRPTTVKEAILASGGLSGNAAMTRAKVIRSDNVQEPVDLNRLIFQGDMSQDLPLYNGDVLYVPRTRGMRLYVLGMVRNPGLFEAQPEGMNLMQALSLANNYQHGAVLSDVKIVRDWPNNPRVISANVEALLYRGDMSQNIPIQDGDVVYVPESFLSNTVYWVTEVLSPLSGVVNVATDVNDLENDR